MAGTNMMAVFSGATLETFAFKNEALTVATNEINTIARDTYTVAETNIRLIARQFGIILTTQAYKDDGFKNLADFAQAVFGLKRSYAYMLAKSGQIIDSHMVDGKYPDVVMQMPLSNLYELSKLDYEKMCEVLNDNPDIAGMSQKEIRALVREKKGLVESTGEVSDGDDATDTADESHDNTQDSIIETVKDYSYVLTSNSIETLNLLEIRAPISAIYTIDEWEKAIFGEKAEFAFVLDNSDEKDIIRVLYVFNELSSIILTFEKSDLGI